MRCNCITATLLFVGLAAAAEAGDPWLGQKVFWKADAKPKVGNREVEPGDSLPPQEVTAVNGKWLWIGRAWLNQSDALTTDQAFDYWSKRIRQNEYSSANWLYRGLVSMALGKTDRAIEDYYNALLMDPLNLQARTCRVAALLKNGHGLDALHEVDVVIRIAPDFAPAHLLRASIWVNSGEIQSASRDFDQAIKLAPSSAEAYLCRGTFRRSLGEFDQAISDYTAAMRCDPRYASVYCAAAWLRASCPDAHYRDGAKAVAHATKACQLTRWNDQNGLAALAAAYAEQGDFARAVQWQVKAIEVTSGEMLKQSLQKQLELYQAGSPFRFPARSHTMIQYAEQSAE